MTIKGRTRYIALLGMLILLCLAFTSCVSKPTTVEELINSNEEIAGQLATSSDSSNMTLEIKGNEIIYSYDLSGIEGATEENLKDEAMIKILQTTLEDQAAAYAAVCKNIEKSSEIRGVTATVNYTYKGEVLATKTFSSAGETEKAEKPKEETETETKELLQPPKKQTTISKKTKRT